MSLMPAGPREWIVDDLDGLPDDGLQYELLDGLRRARYRDRYRARYRTRYRTRR